MKALFLFICLLILSSCASTPQSARIKASGLSSLPRAIELSDTPFYPQTQYQCGPAALATVLQAHGVTTTPELLSTQVYIPEREGSLQIEMTATARRHDMLPYPLDKQMSSLLAEIAAGNPVLVLQNLGLNWFPKWHYAVVVGYDINNQEIILRSGTEKRWLAPFKVFERTWQRANFWGLVIVPVGKIPKTAEPLRYLEIAYAFEETGNSELALRAYQSATKRWPYVVTTWITLGNMNFTEQNWKEAIKAFNTALRLDPESSISWNNLAYALHADGCGTQARMALKCGININPDDTNLQHSWRELIENSTDGEKTHCPVIHCN